MEKIQETFNKDLEELKSKQTMMNSTINEIKLKTEIWLERKNKTVFIWSQHCLCRKSQRIYKKKKKKNPEVISKYSNIIGYKVNIKKSTVFPYHNKQLEFQIFEWKKYHLQHHYQKKSIQI